jgi:hypothetical protein
MDVIPTGAYPDFLLRAAATTRMLINVTGLNRKSGGA